MSSALVCLPYRSASGRVGARNGSELLPVLNIVLLQVVSFDFVAVMCIGGVGFDGCGVVCFDVTRDW